MQFADRLNNVETSAIRELFKLLGKPGIISFAGGFPDSAMFDVEGIREASARALSEEPGAALQYGATEGYNPLREQLAAFMASKGVKGLNPEGLIVTTGSQQALDLVAKPCSIPVMWPWWKRLRFWPPSSVFDFTVPTSSAHR